MKPLPKKTTRAETLINIGKMYKDPKDNKLKLTSITQMDFKIKLPAFIFSTFLPKASKSWYTEVQKRYTKNHKNL